MSGAVSRTSVELDVMRTAEVPTPHGYVFRAERANRHRSFGSHSAEPLIALL